MRVHRKAPWLIEPARVFASIEAAAASSSQAGAHDRWTSCLVEASVLESTMVDTWCPYYDRCDDVIATMRALVDRIGDAVVASWLGRPPRESIDEALAAATLLRLPSRVCAAIPEGFAYHGLYPEVYLDAAQHFVAEQQPTHVLVIGIRPTGNGAASIVAAVVRERGIRCHSYTVRARDSAAHPLALDEMLRLELVSPDEDMPAAFAIVGEWPDENWAFGAVSDGLESLGVAAERIAFFPSSDPKIDLLKDEHERRPWRRHRRYVGSFDDLYLRSGRLAGSFGGTVLTELSGGRWRDVLGANGIQQITVHPGHEQRKFLFAREGQLQVLKFVGHGAIGADRVRLGDALARRGFVQRPIAFSAGMMAYPFAVGRPMTRADVTPGFLRHAARYLAHRAMVEGGAADIDPTTLVEMVSANATASLGDAGAAVWLRGLEPSRQMIDQMAPVRVDGRLMPHEWLCMPNGWIKCDAVSHHADEFLPGCVDIAWDVAGMIDEWSLTESERQLFLETFTKESGDNSIEQRLCVWRVAYLAFRAGYTKLALETLGESRDAQGMGALHERYATLLASALAALPRA